jgi:hypothetical protein
VEVLASGSGCRRSRSNSHCATTGALVLPVPLPSSGLFPRNRRGLPGSWASPRACSPCSSTPDEPRRQAIRRSGAAGADVKGASLLERAISGLNHTAPTLAVYASQCGSPRAHARLASGWWPAFAGQDWVPARAHVRRFRCTLSYLLSPLHLPLLQASPGALTRGPPARSRGARRRALVAGLLAEHHPAGCVIVKRK